ncbi:MAG: acyl-CoA dehydratase activase, partial [Elusimicrobiota bacterium]
MKSIGIDIGSCSVKAMCLNGGTPEWIEIIAHEGEVRDTICHIIKKHNVNSGISALATGGDGRHQLEIKSVALPIAIEESIKAFDFNPAAVVSLGGEELVVYALKNGRIFHTITGDKCASGTGEFFQQQLFRMNMTLNDVSAINPGARVCKLSSRCSVFMKSDCTHKLNKREADRDDIVLSLSMVMAKKVAEFLKRAKIKSGRVLLIGGVSRNIHLVKSVAELMPHLEIVVSEQSTFFECYGAAAAARNYGQPLPDLDRLFCKRGISYKRLPPLIESSDMVDFIPSKWGHIRSGGEYIMGVDGGSTTTKIALIDSHTREIVAAHYDRTHGDPIGACRKCLVEIRKQIEKKTGENKINISLVATTGSSREILGVFLETPAVYNEIIAHAEGTTYYNSHIDTMFEIGGQDAKYVYLKNNVPIDYAMNEACSAGTGSFLEESASGDLSIRFAHEIGDIALRSDSPLKFGEHCSAFINSDIRKAIQEGASREDIVGGLIYSIVSNYLNRVVGNRSIGDTVVLQGGVAKNKAVPMAFAAILKKRIIVPPDPELMGCFGVAMLAAKKCDQGLIEKSCFDLNSMINSEIQYTGEFRCKECENNCPIRILLVNGKRYFFGGRCNKYTLIRKKIKVKPKKSLDYISLREKMIFSEFCAPFEKIHNENLITVGVPLCFSIYNLWVLFSWFFYRLGVKAVLVRKIAEHGVEKCESSYCFPAEIAHGTIQSAVTQNFDYLFLPHLKYMESYEDDVHACMCPIIQGLPYYVKYAFEEMPEEKILAPIFDFKNGYLSDKKQFMDMAQAIGFGAKDGEEAFEYALQKQFDFWKSAREIGEKVIQEARSKNQTVIVLMGRPYNAFSELANMGIPKKFHSRGYTILPMDFLPLDDQPIPPNMYWYFGQQNLKAAVICKSNQNLFPCYISNFSCAPDSFILHHLRFIMGSKPFLVLELDSHSADAGVDTRIEAFLDIIEGYTIKLKEIKDRPCRKKYKVVLKGKQTYVVNIQSGEKFGLRDPRIKILIPSMGYYGTMMIGEILRSNNIAAINLPVSDNNTIQLARNVASGKECIPTLLTLGATLQYFSTNKISPESIYLVILPKTTGPCRTGQYGTFFERIFDQLGLENVSTLELNSDNSYTELGAFFSKAAWVIFIISDYIKDIEIALQILAVDQAKAMEEMKIIKQDILNSVKGGFKKIFRSLKTAASRISAIAVKGSLHDLKKVFVVGEIYVRRDDFSQKELVERLAKNNIMVKLANLAEWVHYTDFIRKHRLRREIKRIPLYKRYFSKQYHELQYILIEGWWKHQIEKRILNILKPTGLIPHAPHDMDKIMRHTDKFL